MEPMKDEDLREFQAQGFGKVIDGFPYIERYCPYCERKMTLVNAIHIQDDPMHYKAVLICMYHLCPHMDRDPCGDAYVRIYYSSQYAADELTRTLLKYWRPSKESF